MRLNLAIALIAILAVSKTFATKEASRPAAQTASCSHSLEKPSRTAYASIATEEFELERHLNSNDTDDACVEKNIYQNEVKAESFDKENNLIFQAQSSLVSDPLPLPNKNRTIVDFFLEGKNRFLLLTGGHPLKDKDGNDVLLPRVEPFQDDKSKIMERWSTESQRAGLTPDYENDELLVVHGVPTPLLGLTLYAETVLSIKIVPNGASGFPEFELLLIKDDVRAEGPKPLVWLHRKIKKTLNPDVQAIHMRTFVRVEKAEKDPEKIVFTFDSELDIDIPLKPMLVKLLPMRREKFNAQGSAAIQKTFDKRFGDSLTNFLNAYTEWLE